MLGQGWQSQWKRVQTRLTKVQAIYVGSEDGTFDALDQTLSFFEATHHLKDWLGNDSFSGLSRHDGDGLINGSVVLQLCADLANGSKHLSLSGARTGDLSTAIIRSAVTISVGAGTIAHRFSIQSDGMEYDALEIAESAVEEWATFLSCKGLL